MEKGVILETVVSHMLRSSAVNQYFCNKLQIFLHDLKMLQRLKFTQKVQICDSTNLTNLLHYPRVSQDCLVWEFLRSLSISFIGVFKAVSVVIKLNILRMKPGLDYPDKKIQVFCHLNLCESQNLGGLLDHVCRVRYRIIPKIIDVTHH